MIELKALSSTRRFKLKQKQNTATARVAIDDNVTQTTEIPRVSTTQVPVIDDDRTTCHELQETNKNKLIGVGWTFVQDWAYKESYHGFVL